MLRNVTGLVLAVYIATHLFNHALGVISVAWTIGVMAAVTSLHDPEYGTRPLVHTGGLVLLLIIACIVLGVLLAFPLNPLPATFLLAPVVAIVLGAFVQCIALPVAWRLAITTGFLGGLTTFSTFSGETVTLMLRQQYGWSAAIIAAHLVGSLALTLAGIGLVRMVLR